MSAFGPRYSTARLRTPTILLCPQDLDQEPFDHPVYHSSRSPHSCSPSLPASSSHPRAAIPALMPKTLDVMHESPLPHTHPILIIPRPVSPRACPACLPRRLLVLLSQWLARHVVASRCKHCRMPKQNVTREGKSSISGRTCQESFQLIRGAPDIASVRGGRGSQSRIGDPGLNRSLCGAYSNIG